MGYSQHYQAEQTVILYGKWQATYKRKDPTKEGRHEVVMLEGPDKGRTLTAPGERMSKATKK